MGPIQQRVRGLESAISTCLIAILFLIGVGVFVKQFDADISRFGIETDITQLSPQRPEINRKDIMDLGSLVPGGFERLSKTEIYNPENLYEKIDGKAPLYIESGFEKLFTQRFVSKADENLWMELFVFDMANIKNAFSIFSVQRRAGADVISISLTSFGYKTSNGLYFVNGRYYIELVGSSESSELFTAMTEVGKKIKKKLPVDKVIEIAELSLFPRENIVSDSAKLYLSNAFGFEGLTDTFTAQYKLGDEMITAFFTRRSNPQEAQIAAESYYNFVINNGGSVKSITNETLKTLKGKVLDFYGTVEIVATTGPFVAGIHEAENQKSAEKLAVMLINKLSEAAKAVNNE